VFEAFFATYSTGRRRTVRQPIRQGRNVVICCRRWRGILGWHVGEARWRHKAGPICIEGSKHLRRQEMQDLIEDAQLKPPTGGPWVREERRKREVAGHPQLEKGRQNLVLRSWPNWQKAHTVLATQGYLPLLEGRLLTPRQRPCPETDRRAMRGRSTRLAVLEALEALQERRQPVDNAHEVAWTSGREPRVTGQELASRLQLHPATVYAHLKQLRALGVIQ
jgi:DNA-binding transcriptional ArsR family regulator